VLQEDKRKAICDSVSQILKEERKRKGHSMTFVAEKAGLSQQMISYVEKGRRMPTLDTLLRITEVLGIELNDVIRRARDEAKTKGTFH
jgi:transcriptional regulator with XRE-family HTH domain